MCVHRSSTSGSRLTATTAWVWVGAWKDEGCKWGPASIKCPSAFLSGSLSGLGGVAFNVRYPPLFSCLHSFSFLFSSSFSLLALMDVNARRMNNEDRAPAITDVV